MKDSETSRKINRFIDDLNILIHNDSCSVNRKNTENDRDSRKNNTKVYNNKRDDRFSSSDSNNAKNDNLNSQCCRLKSVR